MYVGLNCLKSLSKSCFGRPPLLVLGLHSWAPGSTVVCIGPAYQIASRYSIARKIAADLTKSAS